MPPRMACRAFFNVGGFGVNGGPQSCSLQKRGPYFRIRLPESVEQETWFRGMRTGSGVAEPSTQFCIINSRTLSSGVFVRPR